MRQRKESLCINLDHCLTVPAHARLAASLCGNESGLGVRNRTVPHCGYGEQVPKYETSGQRNRVRGDKVQPVDIITFGVALIFLLERW